MIPARRIAGSSRRSTIAFGGGSRLRNAGKLGLYGSRMPPVNALGTPTVPIPRSEGNTNNLISSPMAFTVPGVLYLLHSCRANATLGAATLTNNLGLTQTEIANPNWDNLSGIRNRGRVWAIPIPAATTNLIFTTTNGSTNRQQQAYCFVPFAKGVPDAADVAIGAHASGDPPVDLGHVPAASSVTIGMYSTATAADTPITPPTGAPTEIEDIYGTNSQMQSEVVYAAVGTGVQNVNWSSSGNAAVAVVIEVRQPTS